MMNPNTAANKLIIIDSDKYWNIKLRLVEPSTFCKPIFVVLSEAIAVERFI